MKKFRKIFLPAFLLPKKKMRRHAESSASSSSSSGANKSAAAGPGSKASSKNPGAASKSGTPSTSGGGDAAAGGSDNNNVASKKSSNAALTTAEPATRGSANSTNLSKTYLSKSHDNLASTLRRKANSGQAPAAASVLSSRSQKASSKDDLKSTGATKEAKETKDAKGPGVGLSSSTTAISGAGLPGQSLPRASHRAGVPRKVSSQSASTNASHAAAITSTTTPSSVTLRNRRGVDKRTRVTPLMPSLQVAANEPVAQTLNDGERRCFEQQISELVQNAETKKAEIASQKIEIRHLKEQVDSFKAKEENFLLIQNENSLLRAKLQEAGVSVDLITDAEKENLLRTPTQEASSSVGDEETSLSQAATRGESEGGKDSQDAIEGDSSEGGNAGRGIMMVNAMVSGMTGMLSALPPNLDNKSIEGLSLDESTGWEKQSSDALSEVSVANLQDRIIQMEETHYSTSEELQATLQELSDLQDSLADLTAENERLNEEKDVLVESLLAQTEKLEREREERMKVLLFHNIHSDANGGEGNGANRGSKSPSGSGLLSDREQQLMDLIKAAHGETEELRAKQREMTINLRAAEQENKELSDVMAALKDKIHLLEARSESMYADKRENERRLGDAKETVTSQRMELNKMVAMLESASERCATFQKLVESQNASTAHDSPEGNANDEAKIQLENAKREQENTLATLAATREKLSESEGMTARLRDKVTNLEQKLKESGENAKAQVSDLEYQLANATLEKSKMKKDLDSLKSHVMEVERSCEKYIEEKAEFSISIGNLEDEVEKTTNRRRELEGELDMERRQRQEEQDEWAQFQQDLQTVVVVANDIRKEAQEEMEKTAMENTNLKEKLNQLQAELEKTAASSAKSGSIPGSGVTSPVGRASSPSSLGGVSPSPPESALMSPSPLSPSEIRGRVQSYLSTAVASRGNQKRHDAKTTLSVKDLIQSIEGKNNDAGTGAATKEPGEGDDSLDGVTALDAGMTSPTPSNSGASSALTSSPGSSGHSSLNMMRSQGAIPKNSAEGATGLKGVLKRNVSEFSHRSSPVGTHRSAIKTSTPDTDDAKCREISSRAAGAGTGSSGVPSSCAASDASSVVSRSKPTTLNSSSSLSATTTANSSGPTTASIPSISSILMNSSSFRRNSYSDKPESRDPLAALAKQYGASKRNALLKYVQNRTAHYPGIDITNFSSSWNDGMAFCALVHTYLPETIPYYELSSLTKRRNFELAFSSAEEVGVAPILNINDMVSIERPDWQQVMAYVTSIYKHFET